SRASPSAPRVRGPPGGSRSGAFATARSRQRATGRAAAPACTRASASPAVTASSRRGGSADELITFAPPRPNQRVRSGPIELPAQPLHVDVDNVRQRIMMLVPHVLGNVRAADDIAGVADEVFEQR